MTMPIERTRALRWGWEFLSELRSARNLTPAQLRALVEILNHYPTPEVTSAWARVEPVDAGEIFGPVRWLAPESPDQEMTAETFSTATNLIAHRHRRHCTFKLYPPPALSYVGA